jgi:C-terminal processing protease CtpA/Prc
LPNGWQYRLSVTQTVNLDGRHIENGVPVDIPINLSPIDVRRDRDTLIEAALKLLR